MLIRKKEEINKFYTHTFIQVKQLKILQITIKIDKKVIFNLNNT